MRSIEELERRLGIEQAALEGAVQSGNPIAQALYQEGVNLAQKELDRALLAESIAARPAVSGCQSGGRVGCTCERCF